MTAASTWMALATTIITLVGFVFITRFRIGALLSPISVTLLLLASIFGIRPLLMISSSTYGFYGSDIRAGFDAACLVGLLGSVSIVFGYALASLANHGRDVDVAEEWTPLKDVPERLIARAAIASVVVLAVWLIATVVFGGGWAYLNVMFAGRSADAGEGLRGVPAIVPALPIIAALIVAVARASVERLRPLRRREVVLYWAVVALAVIPPSALGSRRFLLPSLIAAVIAIVLPRWNRRISWRLLVLIVVGFVALAIFPFVRSAGSRTQSSDLIGAMFDYFGTQGIEGILNNFFLSYDTEMFSYIAYLSPQLGQNIPWGFGRGTFGEALLAPVPAALAPWPSWSNNLLTLSFGGDCSQLYCPVPSMFGTLYYDLALPGVVVGAVAVGWLMAGFRRSILNAGPYRFVVLVTLASFTPQIVRGNPISQLWIAVQVIIVVLLVTHLISRARPVPVPHAGRSRLMSAVGP